MKVVRNKERSQNPMEALCRIRDINRSINDFETEFHAEHGVKLNEGMLLCSLSKLGKCSAGQIAGLLGLSSSNSSKVTLSAEKKGLIERLVGENDKRRMFFRLTAKGEECIGRIHFKSGSIIALIDRIREI